MNSTPPRVATLRPTSLAARRTLVTAALWAAVVAGVVGLYGWTVATSEPPTDSVGVYNRLADGFAHGRLSLGLRPPDDLLRLQDPTDFSQSSQFRKPPYVDLILHDKRFYAYWGPVPALFFLPTQVVGAGRLSDRAVTLTLCLVTLALLALLLLDVRRRWAPSAPSWAVPVGLAALAVAGAQLWFLRKAEVYTLAIAAGQCFVVGGLLALLRGTEPRRPRLGLLALGSLCMGLAFGSRWSLAPALLVPVVALALLWRRTDRSARVRLALALLGPVFVAGIALCAYNLARFGSPADTGVGSMLWGFDPGEKSLFFSPSFEGVSYYVTRPFVVSAQFPYFWLRAWHGSANGYAYTEPSAGTLWTSPIVLIAPLAWVVLRRRVPGLAAGILALVALAAAIFLPNLLYRFAAMRYHGDFDAFVVLASVAGTLGLLSLARGRSIALHRALSVTFVALVAATVAVNVALSAGLLTRSKQGTLDSLSRFFAPVPTAASMIAGHSLLAGVDGKPLLGPQPQFAVSARRGHAVRVISPDDRVIVLEARLAHVTGLADDSLSVGVRTRAGESPRVPVTGQVARFPVRVHQGLNDLRFVLGSAPGVFPSARYALVDRVRIEDPPH